MVLEKINLSEIVCDSNRKYTKDDGFEQLLNSIKEYGIIEPPVVRPQSGEYRVVAGRRRIEAARKLKFAEVDCMIMQEGDPLNDEEIALTENVNRLEMHPLDEAAAFRRMADEGASAEEIARYYARSPSAIYKRLRLASLIEELKVWFRDGILNISGAAVLAELPEEDQKAFYDEYLHLYQGYDDEPEDKDDDNEVVEIDSSKITAFVYKRQKNEIRDCLGEACKTCGKRTHNEGNELFEEFDHLSDVCLDAECYRSKYAGLINRELAGQMKAQEADLKIHLVLARGGILGQIYKKATHINFDLDGKETRFEVLGEKDWNFTGKTGRKTKACFEIYERYGGDIEVRRVGYEEKQEEKEAKETKAVKAGKTYLDDIFGKEAAKEFAAERGMKPAELTRALEEKNKMHDFDRSDIGELVFKRVVENNIIENRGIGPKPNYFGMYMKFINLENMIDMGENKKLLKDITGLDTLSRLGLQMPDELQYIFHLLLLVTEADGHSTLSEYVPDLDGVITNKMSHEQRLFMEYAGLDKDAYKELWMQCAREKYDEIMKPKEKKPGKKKTVKKAAAPHGGDASADDDEGEDNYPFEPDPETDDGE